MINRGYIRLTNGQHSIIRDKKYKSFSMSLDINHFKWRDTFIPNQEERIRTYKKT